MLITAGINAITDKENKNEWFAFKNYTREYMIQSINKSAILNNHLAALWYRLKKDFQQNAKTHPFVRPSTDTL